ncbi:hypothetical protein NIES2101_37460 [Calothrix sp. HK-06]|nr:hypothetical protein NIES2101_37460 [Calothrix sp. HK-06]
MSITIFSQSLNGEFDIEQFLILKGYTEKVDINIKINKLSKIELSKINQDVLCPICRSQGSIIVKKTKLKQAHFRFSNHKYFCDYNKSILKELKTSRDIDFSKFRGKDRTAQTQIVRKLVAKGVEQGFFSQKDIDEMRIYFYKSKEDSQFLMDVSKTKLDWFFYLKSLNYKHFSFIYNHFKPIYIDLPTFDWNEFAQYIFKKNNEKIIEKTSFLSFINIKVRQQIYEIIKSTENKLVFDVKDLYIPYKNTIELTKIIVSAFSKSDKWVNSDIFLAFSALLLYISEWDVSIAVENFIYILNSPEPIDINEGNVIGLNPFYNFEAWLAISHIREVVKENVDGFDFYKQLETIERELKDKYES